METNNEKIIQRIEEMYKRYEVDTKFLNSLNNEQKLKGMKGILAELDLNKKKNYTQDDLLFIRNIYSMFC